ncbi:MAG: hypothetical protein Q8932_03140 [Bacteroidota bacterium]|nr:hypothetical protein [Bacteroidota bacterium]
MKKSFFSILAMALLSTTAFAGGGKPAAKRHKATTTQNCPSNCPRTQDCPKGADCTHMPDCPRTGCGHS